jgi:hypothetical protein
MRVMRALLCFVTACLWIPFSAAAGEVVIENVEIVASSAGGYNFSVTLRHDDTGWDHYADKWLILSGDGKTILGERVLFHPHIDEQPFTRGMRAVLIPEGVTEVIVRAHDRQHRWSKQEYIVKVPGR